MQDLISVIIPVYNVRAYLKSCLDSVFSQTYTNLEILLVDDGSTDGSSDLCDSFEKTDSRVRVIHQKNRGLSGARNRGIEAAAGDWLTFVDSDDRIRPDYCRVLHDLLTFHQADMSICNFAVVSETGEEIPRTSPLKKETLSGYEALGKLQEYYAVYYTTAWAAMYRRALFDNLRFREGRLHEDEYLIHHMFHACRRVAVTDEVLYDYIQHEGTIMKELSVRRLDGTEALCERYWFYRELGMDEYAQGMDDIFHVVYFGTRFRIRAGTNEERKRMKEIDRLFRRTYRDLKPDMPRRERLMLAFPDVYAALRG